MCTKFWFENFIGKEHFGDTVIGGKIILKSILDVNMIEVAK
jgi:hypothetical protein